MREKDREKEAERGDITQREDSAKGIKREEKVDEKRVGEQD